MQQRAQCSNRKGSDVHAQGDTFMLKVTNTRPAPPYIPNPTLHKIN